MLWQGIRRPLAWLESTPFHPQWLVLDRAPAIGAIASLPARGILLDLGSGNQWARSHIPPGVAYVPVDHPVAGAHWEQQPMIYGDAEHLPVRSGTIDAVLLLDVLEHLRSPAAALAECRRVLVPGGRVIAQVPFAYPLHESPRDFTRWTHHGLEALAASCGLTVVDLTPYGHPAAASCALMNLALAHTVLGWWRDRSPLALGVLIAAPLFLLFNLLGWSIGKLSPEREFLPTSYLLVLANGGGT